MTHPSYEFGLTKTKAPNTGAIPDDDDDAELERWIAFGMLPAETNWSKWGLNSLLLIVVAFLVSFTYFSSNRARDYASKMNKLGNLTEIVALKTENFHNRLHDLEPKITSLKMRITPQINWLSPAFGVEIIPSLCSPSMPRQVAPAIENRRWWWTRIEIWQWYQHKNSEADHDEPRVSDPHGPYAALRSKLEHEPVYCTPPSYEKLYLSAKLPRLIAPTSLIIEHWQKDAVIEIGSAPKQFELWIKVPDEVMDGHPGPQVQLLMMERYGRGIIDGEGSQQRRKMPEPVSTAFSYPWIPVGRWTYDIYGPSPIQKFFLPVNLSDYNIYTQEVAIRVNSNWGNVESTCLVQVKLHGQVKDGIRDGIELPEDDLRSYNQPKWYYSEYKFEPDSVTISDSEKEYYARLRYYALDTVEEWKNPKTAEERRLAKVLWAEADERESKIPVMREDRAYYRELDQRMSEQERKWEEECARKSDEANAQAKAKNEALKKRLNG